MLPGAFADLDNTARYGKPVTVFEGANLAKFEHGLDQLAQSLTKLPSEEDFLCIKAWNECAEDPYMKVEERNGLEWLRAAKPVDTRYLK